jgi:hypothetical protein
MTSLSFPRLSASGGGGGFVLFCLVRERDVAGVMRCCGGSNAKNFVYISGIVPVHIVDFVCNLLFIFDLDRFL